MEKKYELVRAESALVGGKTLFRIRALRDFGEVRRGDLGGFVESESNLSHRGKAWVAGGAKAYGRARVGDDAQIADKAEVFGQALVVGSARVGDAASIRDKAVVADAAVVCGDALIGGRAQVGGEALVSGFAWVGGEAVVGDSIWLHGNAVVGDVAASSREEMAAHQPAVMAPGRPAMGPLRNGPKRGLQPGRGSA